MSQAVRILVFVSLLTGLIAIPSLAERHHIGLQIEGPLHELDKVTGETRIEALDNTRIAIAVDRENALGAEAS